MAINHGSLSARLTPKKTLKGTVQTATIAYESDYERLTNKPSINNIEVIGDLSLNDLGIVNNVQPDWEQDDTEAEDYIKNKPEIPDAQIQSDWEQTDEEAKDYIKNKPEIPSAQVQSDWNEADNTKPDFIKNKPTIPPEQVNSDWNAVSGKAQILNKPTIPSVIANPGNTTENLTSIGINGTNYAIQGGGGGGAVDSVNGKTGDVILDAEDVGALPNDTPLFSGDYDDLTNKPTIPDDLADLNEDSTHRLVTDTEKTTWNGKSDFSGSYTDLTDKPTLGTASALDVASSGDASTSEVVKGNDTRLTDSRNAKDVYSWAKESTKPTYAYSEIQNTPTLGTASAKDYVNSVVDGSSDLVTSDAVHDYVDSAISGVYKPSGNKTCSELLPALLIASNLGNVYNMTDSGVTTSDFVEGAGKTIEIGDNVVIVDVGTQNNASYKFDLLSGMVDLSNYIQKSATSGLMKNDGSVDTNSYATTSQIPDITGKADKVTSAVDGNFAGLDSNGNLTDSGHKHSDYLTQHQDISGKADKVPSATNGNLAGLNGSGNLTDSGWNGAKDTTSVSGNPISISGLKSNQLAVNPIITLEPIQDLHGQSKPYPSGGGKNKYGSGDISGTQNATVNLSIPAGTYTISAVCTSSDTDASTCLALVRYTDTTYHAGVQLQRTNRSSATFVLAKQAASITFYASDTNAHSSGDTFTVKSIQIEEGTQATDYAPYSNICPISGYDKIEVLSCGVNVWDEVWELGELNAQGQNASSTTKIRSKNYIPVVGGSTYYLKLSSASAQVFICFYDVNKTFISSNSPYQGTFTVPLMARYCRFNCPATYGTTYNNDMGINYPATQTSYVTYDKTTSISESLGQTVYGGTLDVRTGKLTDIPKLGDLGDFTWLRWGSGIFYTDINDKINASATVSSLICASCFNYVGSFTGSLPEMNNGDMLDCYTSGYEKRIFVRDIRYDDATAFKTAMAGQKLVYKVATPTEIQLTPHEISLLKDYAYVSTNGTNMQLSYHNGEMASLSDVSQLGETVNEILNQTSQIKIINMPYNTFIWNDNQKAFSRAINLDTNYIIGFIVTPLNGTASMSAYYSSNSGYLWVMGFIPKTGASIDNTYEFICNVVYKV